MNPFTEYLIKVSLGFVVVSLLYMLVLRRLTFYTCNRIYLLLASALCFFVPILDFDTVFNGLDSTSGKQFLQQVPSVSRIISNQPPAMISVMGKSTVLPVEEPGSKAVSWVLIMWSIGVAAMLIRLAVQMGSLARIMRHARLTYDNGLRIYHTGEDISPFSFCRSIVYNPELHREQDLRVIMFHELAHVRQYHSLDIIWGELLCIINWFNPFAWLLTRAIRQNLEYIADRQVLKNHTNPKSYQYLLLKTTVRTDLGPANQFGYHSLKQRIAMMNKE